jgi:hypothetical protein
MNRSWALVLNVTKRNLGPPPPVKSSVPGAPPVPVAQVPTCVASVFSTPSLFCTMKMVGTGVTLLSKTKYPMPTPGCPGLVGSVSGFVCAKLNAHLKLATGQVVFGPAANAPLVKNAAVQIAATTNEIALKLKKTPPSELRAIKQVAAQSVN